MYIELEKEKGAFLQLCVSRQNSGWNRDMDRTLGTEFASFACPGVANKYMQAQGK